jgi:hypothetical protein
MWDLWWTKWHWDRFFPEYFGFSCQFYSTGAPFGKTKKKSSSSQAFTISLQGCGASVASAAGPFTKKTHQNIFCRTLWKNII